MPTKAERTALHARRTGDRGTLFWSERGEVCCARHAPYPGTDTWRWQRWSAMTEAEMLEWSRVLGQAPECEVCRTQDA